MKGLKILISFFFGFTGLYCGCGWAQFMPAVANKTYLLSHAGLGVPLKDLADLRMAVVTADAKKYQVFIDQLNRYAHVEVLDFTEQGLHANRFNTFIVTGTVDELKAQQLYLLQCGLVDKKNMVLCTFLTQGQQAFLQLGGRVTELLYPGFSADAQRNMAMSIFGGLAITSGDVSQRTTQTRLQYTVDLGDTYDLGKMANRIDGIANEAIRERATPGMVVMAVKDGQVIFEKSYGWHTYSREQQTQVSDIFDLASVTKVVGTTPVIMHLQEIGVLNLDHTIGDYLPAARTTNKASIPLRAVLLHEAGFVPFIPFYKNLKPGDMQADSSATHQVKVAEGAYLRNFYYQDRMWPEMLMTDVKPMGNYLYSDISMYVMQEIAETQTHTPIDKYVQQLLFDRLGMTTAGYNPWQRFDKSKIVPTEVDKSFRKGLLQGYVHDQGAAMAGGVAGHAGLFATANDLAIYGQLLLNRGHYGGLQFFKAQTVDLFTSRQSKTSRRGLGFDRYDMDTKKEYPSKLANASVYGHTGYTGTCFWVDPENQLVYIFLSNRVHPDVSPKLLELNIRGRILDTIYEAIRQPKSSLITL